MGNDKTVSPQSSSSKGKSAPSAPVKPVGKLSAAARRALEEARQRRAAIDDAANAFRDEIGGRRGREPVRYGDWESKGIASDF